MSTPVVNVVDDDPAVSSAISLIAKNIGYAAAIYRSAEDFLYGHDPERPGCLILDLKMPGNSGLEIQKMLLEAGVEIPMIIVSGNADVPMAVVSMSRGAYMFLEKPFRMDVLQQHISNALELDASRRAIRAKRHRARQQLSRLTEKEQEVLRMILQGLTNKQMAEGLGLTVRAIEDRRSRLMRKLEVNTLIELLDMVNSAGGFRLDSPAPAPVPRFEMRPAAASVSD